MDLLLVLTVGMFAMVLMAGLLQAVYPGDEPPAWFDRFL